MMFKGQKELEAALQRLQDPELIARVQTKQASDMIARGHAPGGTPVKTSKLRQSMTPEPDLGGAGAGIVSIGYGMEYAPCVEYGTRHQRAQGFLKRNRDAQEKIYKEDLIKVIEKAVKG